MTLRKREAGGEWMNDRPISTIFEALDLLRPVYNDGRERYLSTRTKPEELCADWYHEGSSGARNSGTEYYEIEPKIAQKLHAEGFVEKKRIPRIGYTQTVQDRFVLSRKGTDELEHLDRQAKKITV